MMYRRHDVESSKVIEKSFNLNVIPKIAPGMITDRKLIFLTFVVIECPGRIKGSKIITTNRAAAWSSKGKSCCWDVMVLKNPNHPNLAF